MWQRRKPRSLGRAAAEVLVVTLAVVSCGLETRGTALDSPVAADARTPDATVETDATAGGDATAEGAAALDGATSVDATTDAAEDAASACEGLTPGARVCLGGGASGFCTASDASLLAQTDRSCPPGSACVGGYCQHPSGAASCQRYADCPPPKVCDLYVAGNLLEGYCTDPLPGATLVLSAYGACTSDAMCPTGLCSVDGNDSSHRECLFPCKSGADCPNGASCHAVGTPTAIEGVSTSAYMACYN